jgi:hypothetical protein
MNNGSVTLGWFIVPGRLDVENEDGGFQDTDHYRKRGLHKHRRELQLLQLTFQVIRGRSQGPLRRRERSKDLQCVMRHKGYLLDLADLDLP